MEEHVVMPKSPNDSESDIKNQVLSDYFLHRKSAINLKNRGAYWLALDEFKTILSGTPLSKESYIEADKMIEEIDEIEHESYKQHRKTLAKTVALQRNYRDLQSKRIFNSVLRKTTQILQVEGYLDIPLHNANSSFFDPSNDKKSGQRFKK